MTRKLALAVLSLTVLASCFPRVRPSDAGDHSFARQIVPLTLGRKAMGHDEVKLLGDLAAAAGRDAVVRALTRQPEYIDHWTEVIIDRLRINRIAGEAKFQGTCYGEPLRTAVDGELAEWVRDHGPDGGAAPGGPFNMTDLVRSALVLDDLSPVYRAHLFAMVSRPIRGNEITELNKRDDLGIAFNRVYLHRQMLCLGCHSSEWSYSGEDSGWDRTHAIPGHFERAIWGETFSYFDTNRANALFRTDVSLAPTDTTGGIAPWGLQGCGLFRRPTTDTPELPSGTTDYFITDRGQRGSVWDLEQALRNGYSNLNARGLQRTGSDSDGDGFNDTIAGDDAFAYLTAVNITNDTWTELMGYPLTIPNYYPRNAAQRDALWNLSEFHFVANRWSPRALISRTATATDTFNRKSPRTIDTTATAYEMPMLFDPFVEADPREPAVSDPAAHNNAMSESIHRYSPRSLLYSVHRSLGWPAPRRFPQTTTYPTLDLERAIGQYLKDAEPGFAGVDFQGLLFWEAVHGAGTKPANHTGDDWVDRLIRAVAIRSATSSPATLRDVVQTTRDWFLADARISGTAPREESMSETAALAAHFGVSNLDVSALSVADLETKLRRYIGVLVQTPQFMLAGLAPEGIGQRPLLRVCNDGPCTYRELCISLVAAFAADHLQLGCGNNLVSVLSIPLPGPGTMRVAELCPSDLCTPINFDETIFCPGGNCLEVQPPRCDPRCARIDCCGGPGGDFADRNGFLAWADGGVVRMAENVVIRPKGSAKREKLTARTRLSTGDVLELQPESRLRVDVKGGRFETPKGGLGKPMVFMVTGAEALRAPKPVKLTDEQIKALTGREFKGRGEGGVPQKDPKKQHDPESRKPKQ